MQHQFRAAAALLLAVAVGACERGTSTAPETLGPISHDLTVQLAVEQCTTVDFDTYSHGDAVTAVNVLGVPLTLSSIRYNDLVAVNPTAYDVELTGDVLAGLNDTHDDTQAARDCAQCAGHARILVVPDPNFAVGGDNTQGGEILISGFADDPDPTAVWSITDFDVVDADANQGFTTLYVDDVQTAQNTRTGNATVETVAVPANTITTGIRFTIGSLDADASSGIDNLVVCRTTTEEEDGEGCTPGYWKQEQHFDSWMGYAPTDYYDDVFGVGPHITLLAALESGGGGQDALLRHSVAALLNSAGDVAYGMSDAQIIAAVQAAYATGTKDAFNAAKDVFEELNERYCPLD
jgi:hypothetical protein